MSGKFNCVLLGNRSIEKKPQYIFKDSTLLAFLKVWTLWEQHRIKKKIFHLKFDVTQLHQIFGGRFFWILCSSQNVQTLCKATSVRGVTLTFAHLGSFCSASLHGKIWNRVQKWSSQSDASGWSCFSSSTYTTIVSFLSGLGQKLIVMCLLLCPNSQ